MSSNHYSVLLFQNPETQTSEVLYVDEYIKTHPEFNMELYKSLKICRGMSRSSLQKKSVFEGMHLHVYKCSIERIYKFLTK